VFSVFKVLYPTSVIYEVTHQVKGFLISRVVAQTGSIPLFPCECAHRAWIPGPKNIFWKTFLKQKNVLRKLTIPELNEFYKLRVSILHMFAKMWLLLASVIIIVWDCFNSYTAFYKLLMWVYELCWRTR